MGKRKHSIGSIGFLVTIVFVLLAFAAVQSGAVNQWFLPNEDAGSFQLKILRVKQIRAPQAAASADRTLTIYSPTLSGTVTNSGTVTGGNISAPTLSSGQFNYTNYSSSGTTGAAQANNSNSVTGYIVDLANGPFQTINLITGVTTVGAGNGGASIFVTNTGTAPVNATLVIRAGSTQWPIFPTNASNKAAGYDPIQYPNGLTLIGGPTHSGKIANATYVINFASNAESGGTTYVTSGVTTATAP